VTQPTRPAQGALTRWIFEEYRIGGEGLAVSRVLTDLYLLTMVYPRDVLFTGLCPGFSTASFIRSMRFVPPATNLAVFSRATAWSAASTFSARV
jgi:hypothetical protein